MTPIPLMGPASGELQALTFWLILEQFIPLRLLFSDLYLGKLYDQFIYSTELLVDRVSSLLCVTPIARAAMTAMDPV